MAARHYDTCECGAPKKKESRRCKTCVTAWRRAGREQLDRDRDLGYWNRNGRYALLAVSGYAHDTGGSWGTTLTIVDVHDACRELVTVTATGSRAHYERMALIRQVKRMNREDRVAV